MFKIDLVVTRHPGLVDYLREVGLVDDDVDVVKHATPALLRGRNVCGVLPHSLSSLCKTFTEVPLVVPQSLRGEELRLEQVRALAGPPATYTVEVVDVTQ